MIIEAFKTVLSLSVAGGLLIIILLLLKPLTEKRLGAVWQYYIWLAVVAVMLCPFYVKLPSTVSEMTTDKIFEAAEIVDFMEIKPVNFTESKILHHSFSLSPTAMAASIWIGVALFFLLYKITGYLLFKREIYKNSYPNFKQGRICVRKTSVLGTPLLIGIFKPMLLIPEKELSKEECEHIMAHELMHYKRCDILYKWLATIVKCLHWFNPLVYVLTREIDVECEISCDILLTRKMNEQERKSYMNTVLALIERRSVKKILPVATMASNKRTIKKRFKMIKAYVIPKLHIKIISVLVALCLSASGLFVNMLFLSAAAYTEKTPLSAEITNSIIPQKKQKESAPQTVISQAEPEKAEEESDVTPEELIVPEQAPEQEELRQQIKQETASEDEYVNMDIIDLGEEKNAEAMAALVENYGSSYIKGSFNFEDGSRKIISGIKPDENGNITLHFYSKAQEIIEIDFWETERKKGVWGVKIPANGNCAYSFSGFDKNKEYSISLYSPAKENWKIDSEYIIY